MSVQLDVGKSYRTRDGQKVHIVGYNDESGWPYEGILSGCNEKDVWRSDGTFMFTGGMSPLDLVSEWSEPETLVPDFRRLVAIHLASQYTAHLRMGRLVDYDQAQLLFDRLTDTLVGMSDMELLGLLATTPHKDSNNETSTSTFCPGCHNPGFLHMSGCSGHGRIRG